MTKTIILCDICKQEREVKSVIVPVKHRVEYGYLPHEFKIEYKNESLEVCNECHKKMCVLERTIHKNYSEPEYKWIGEKMNK